MSKFSKDNFSKYFEWVANSKVISARILLLISCLFCCYLSLIIRLFDLATIEEDKLYQRSFFGYHKFKEERKEIVDRNGELLAVNLSTASLYANPKKIIDPKEAVDQLSKIMPQVNKQELLQNLSSDKTFFWIKRDLTPKEQYGIHNLGIPGFDFQQDQKRVYTYSNLLSHLLGYVGRDGNGLGGVELYFDKFLRNIDSGSAGPLELSVDVRVQNIVSEELDDIIKKFSAQGAIGVVADVTSGEILALVNKPDFDPHAPGKANPEALFNKATLGAYELGSVMKIMTFAIGFDTKKIQLNDLYNITTPLRISGYTIKDFYPKSGWRTVPETFIYSSNIGTVQIALEVGKDTFRKYLRSLGFFNQTSLELKEKATPLYPPSRSWGDLSMATISYGHGIAVSPMHLIQAMIPIVNGGYLHPLTLLKKDKNAISTPPLKVLDDSTSFFMNKLLRLTIEKGSGKRAEVDGYLPGGKTGTANKASNGGYDKKARFSSFVSAFPMNDPKYVLYIMIDNPQGIAETHGAATGSYTAAPATSNIIRRMGTLYGIKPFDPDDADVKNILHVDYIVDEDT
jgi:cell division protein FtsI (penicillin-binding protein 3)